MRATVFANLMDLAFPAGQPPFMYLDIDIIVQNSTTSEFVNKTSARVSIKTITNLNSIRTACVDATVAECARLGYTTIGSGQVVLIGV